MHAHPHSHPYASMPCHNARMAHKNQPTHLHTVLCRASSYSVMLCVKLDAGTARLSCMLQKHAEKAVSESETLGQGTLSIHTPPCRQTVHPTETPAQSTKRHCQPSVILAYKYKHRGAKNRKKKNQVWLRVGKKKARDRCTPCVTPESARISDIGLASEHPSLCCNSRHRSLTARKGEQQI